MGTARGGLVSARATRRRDRARGSPADLPEWQEARFEAPRSSAFVLTTAEEDDVRGALTKLARAAVEYVAGRGRVEQARGLVGRRAVLVLRTVDGEWRIGRRTSDLRP